MKVTDLDTAHTLTPTKAGASPVPLEVPITNEAERLPEYRHADRSRTTWSAGLTFSRTLKGLRNTVLLPAGWEVSAVSQSATIGQYEGRAFVALINLNAENQYAVRIRAARAH
jgi:hypothetical protein